MSATSDIRDVIIIGSGPAGRGARSRRNVPADRVRGGLAGPDVSGRR
jgi:hypothetical protein